MEESLRFLNQSAPKRPCLGAGGGRVLRSPPATLVFVPSAEYPSSFLPQGSALASLFIPLFIFAHSFRYQSEVSSSETHTAIFPLSDFP